MPGKIGTANLPLHGGRAPRWLFRRMVKLAGDITEAVVYEYGPLEFLRRISDPYWFQAFSCVLGFDWHSSGTTTTTCGALKSSLDPAEHGILVAGGKGRASRRTPVEIETAGDLFSLSAPKLEDLVHNSRMVAKIDNSCIQDGYQLYHHVFFLTEEGEWAVVQQGMNQHQRYARRYHWLSSEVQDLVESPHQGICCDTREEETLDMTAPESEEARAISVDLVQDNPEHLKKYFQKKPRLEAHQSSLYDFYPGLDMPAHHPVLDTDLTDRDLEVLQRAWEIQPASYEELLSLEGMGPKKIRALALISDLVYGSRPSWEDPVKYSFTHGGKDGFPYPVDREVYDHSISTLQDALEQARLDKKDRYQALKRLEGLVSGE
ncbi:DUF763 domain-containing protein [Methanobacterium sp. CWC-01]|uniref:DUF763 domain-containing protein n=1 Tax=Methanobacterium aridiramus TaxID=2584467 RepID=UPI002574B714|nr:DUF763 domain-containing protein [Methanobacterium sp. CWC-01]WJI09970.1 DUF763 domain-containing protein [Methanobacterium sp. CWC-01]